MEIRLCYQASENNKIGKIISELARAECTLKDETSIIDPVILFAGDAAVVTHCNYVYIYAFHRWYFVNNVTIVRDGLWEISCHVDVLESFKDGIKAQTAVVARQRENWNLYLNDGFFRTFQDPGVTRDRFPVSFDNNDHRFILVTAGYPPVSP